MLKLILSRVLQGGVVLLIVSALTFALLNATGGDALAELSTDAAASEASIKELRRLYGLDEPLATRYLRWLGNLARGRMGESFYYHAPVATIIWPRLLRTLALAVAALLLALSVSLTLGALAASRGRGSWWDRASEIIILLTASTPRIVLALIALAVVARTSWFPVGGAGVQQTVLADFNPLRLVPPAVVLALPLVALFLAQTREGLRHALAEDFVRVARAKGLSERAVITRHAMRAALNPLITLFGYALGSVVSGSVIVETVLGWPGLGSLSVIAVRTRDVPLLMGIVLITATAVLVGNLVADILLRLNDPRLRQEDRSASRGARRGDNLSLNPPASGA